MRSKNSTTTHMTGSLPTNGLGLFCSLFPHQTQECNATVFKANTTKTPANIAKGAKTYTSCLCTAKGTAAAAVLEAVLPNKQSIEGT